MAIDTLITPHEDEINKEQKGNATRWQSSIHRLKGHCYRVQRLNSFDQQVSYLQLRNEIFIERLHWDIPVNDGQEYDHYDLEEDENIHILGVCGKKDRQNYFLSGVRVFALENWAESMTMSEFRDAGMIPDTVLHQLSQHACQNILEITRLCVKRGAHFRPPFPAHSKTKEEMDAGFDLAIARDLTYAMVYRVAEETGRYLALGLAHTSYLHLMKRGKFVFTILHEQDLHDKRRGYALTLIDLPATIRSIRAAGGHYRANCMLALCQDKKAFEHNTRSLTTI